MTKYGNVHWLAPASMFGGLVAAALLAVGHHLFYNGLSGTRVVEDAVFGTSISRQQANIAIGTALAFLFQALLVFVVSVAFIQGFWREVRVRHKTTRPTLGLLDSAFSSFSNFITLFNVSIWWRYPLLLLLALTAWLIPIASIITPATLSVKASAVTPAPSKLLRVPNLDFRSLNFLQAMPVTNLVTSIEYAQSLEGDPNAPRMFPYTGPSSAVEAVVGAVMAQGNVVAATPPAANSSWELDFYGPSLSCGDMDGDAQQSVKKMINYASGTLYDAYEYLAWFPNANKRGVWQDTQKVTIPYSNSSNSGNFQLGSFVPDNYYGAQPLTLYLAVMPIPNISVDNTISDSRNFAGSSMLQCQLLNSTYHTTFTFVENTPDIATNVIMSAPGDQMFSVQGVDGGTGSFSGGDSTNVNCTNANLTCWSDEDLLPKLAYQAVADAFMTYLEGSIYAISSGGYSTTTRVLDTVLGQAEELEAVAKSIDTYSYNTGETTLQAFLSDQPEQRYKGITTTSKSKSGLSTGKAIEMLFQNIVVSLMSSPALQPNYTSVYAPPLTKVTLHQVNNVYAYTAWKLWTAYGIALALATITVVFGFIAITSNGASYSNNLSTLFLKTKGADIDTYIKEPDFDGSDSLPKYLANAHVHFGGFGGRNRAVVRKAYRLDEQTSMASTEPKEPGADSTLLNDHQETVVDNGTRGV